MTIDPTKTYTATVKTTAGPSSSPSTPRPPRSRVNNFVFLAEQGFYHCVIFHRVIPGFMDQTGDPTGTGHRWPGLHHRRRVPGPSRPTPRAVPGRLGGHGQPHRASPNTDGSQFFIVAGPQGESLPPDYSLFGQVTSGMSVVQKINRRGLGPAASRPR